MRLRRPSGLCPVGLLHPGLAWNGARASEHALWLWASASWLHRALHYCRLRTRSLRRACASCCGFAWCKIKNVRGMVQDSKCPRRGCKLKLSEAWCKTQVSGPAGRRQAALEGAIFGGPGGLAGAVGGDPRDAAVLLSGLPGDATAALTRRLTGEGVARERVLFCNFF